MGFLPLLASGWILAAATLCANAQEPPAGAAEAQPAQEPPAEEVRTIPVGYTDEPEPLPGRDEPDAPAQLDDVVVTATKRATPLREIPSTIEVLDGEDLEREGIQSIDQIVAQVPGVNLTDEGTGGETKRITIRGISTSRGANPTAGILFGDLPFSDPFAPKVQLDPNPFDIATVEVLKGPQGTLFGGTGLNGLIRYVPEEPDLDAFGVKYFGQFHSYPEDGGDAWSYGGVVNVPFADNTAAVRVMGFKREAPGYVDDTQNGVPDVNTLSQYGVRAMATWLPADAWKISLMGVSQHTQDNDLAFTDNYGGALQHGNSPRPSPMESRYALASLGIERSFDWGDLVVQSSWFEKEFDIFLEASRAVGGQLPLLAGVSYNTSEAFVQEVRAVSAPGDSPWTWLVGAFHYDMHLYDCSDIGAAQGLPIDLPPWLVDLLLGVIAQPCPENAPRMSGSLDIGQLKADIDLQEQALFGEIGRELGEHWEVTLGARAYRVETAGTVSIDGALYVSANQGQPGARDAAVTQEGISPKASIVFKPTDDLRAYLTASRGFRFGGPQLAAPTLTSPDVPTTYKSDSLWNYELGVRSDWFDRSLRIDASAYRIEWQDAQVFQFTADGLTNFIDNVGGVESEGVEIALRYAPPFLPGLSLDAAGSWSRTLTTEPYESAQAGTIPAGSRWPLAPEVQTVTTLAYLAPPIGNWQLGASVRHTFLDEACNTIECTGLVFDYRTLDATLFAAPIVDNGWPQLSVSMSNITNERGYSSITTNPDIAGDTITYIAPRALIVRLSGSF